MSLTPAVETLPTQTLIFIKTDAYKRGLKYEIMSRFERKGLNVVASQVVTATKEQAQEHYKQLAEKEFFPRLIDYTTKGPIFVAVLEGVHAVHNVRNLMGVTDPLEAYPGTIRGDFGIDIMHNVIHGSELFESIEETMENVGREISIWFPNGLITKPADPEERTLIFIKPDAYKRLKVGPENDKDLVGDLMKRFERKGLKLVAPKAVQATREQATSHYEEHKEKSFFEPLIEYTLSGEVYVAVLVGPNAVEATRKLMGSTNPDFALPGTIRGDFGIDVMHNAIHGSDSIENAEKEVKIWFSEWW